MNAPPRLYFLIGYRGTGKSTLAPLLAKRLGWNWLDADDLLEARHGRSIRVIFAEDGESGFRDKESAILTDLCKLDQHVIATGGGVVLRPENRKRLRAAGRVIWLTADAQTIWQRLQQDPATALRRPDLTRGGLAEIEELLKIREPLYAACADVSLDTTAHSPDELVSRILLDATCPMPNAQCPRTTD